MNTIINAVGSLSQYILPVTEWCSDLAGIVVSVRERGDFRGASRPAGYVQFGSSNPKPAEAIELLLEALTPIAGRNRYISACHLNPTIADDLVVESSGEKVSGRFVFTPDNRVSGQIDAMRLYARVIGDLKGKNVLTFASADQAGQFILISKEGGIEAMQDEEAMSERISFQWQRFPSDGSKGSSVLARRKG